MSPDVMSDHPDCTLRYQSSKTAAAGTQPTTQWEQHHKEALPALCAAACRTWMLFFLELRPDVRCWCIAVKLQLGAGKKLAGKAQPHAAGSCSLQLHVCMHCQQASCQLVVNLACMPDLHMYIARQGPCPAAIATFSKQR